MKKFLFLLGFLLISYFTVSAQIIHVPGDQPTIQAGIDAAQNGNMVLVDDGTYFENINYKGKAITVASNFIIDGDTNHINNTIIDGSQPSHPDSGSVVYFISGEDTTSVLYGFTITGGTGTISFVGAPRLGRIGGGIFIADVGAKISHNYICNNTVADSFAVVGGGLSAGSPTSNSFVIIENNIFDSNSCLRSVAASEGGGMAIGTNARVSNNIFSNNIVSSDSGEAFGGGFVALFNLDSVLIYNNRIINNKVETGIITNPIMDRALGGGFVLWNDSTAFIRMIGNVIAYNEVSSSNYTVGAGGYFELTKGDVIFANNLLYGNHYSGSVSCYGSTLSMRKAKVSIINNTITGNEPSINGTLSIDLDDSSLVMNNILWGNSAGTNQPEIYVRAGNPPDIIYSDVQGGWSGEGNIDADPFFEDPLNSDFHLRDNSPCIGAGIDSIEISGVWYYAPLYDFEGDPRPNPVGSNPDIGADEHPLPVPVPVELTSFTATSQAGKVTLNWTTATEINNLGFEIERKIIKEKEGEWVRIGFKEGYGTTTEPKEYSFVDDISDVNATSMVYRLKQIDFDGSYEYSEEVLVETLAPVDFVLEQNYPNPFNPATTIRFGLPEKSNVVLKVFSSIGEEAAKLVYEEKPAGTYSVKFDASKFPSGVYFYSLQAGKFVETKKMILLK